MARTRHRSWLVGAMIPAILAGTAIGAALSSDRAEGPGHMPAMFWGAPIPGEQVPSLAIASDRTGSALPLLPPMELKDACTHLSSPLELRAIWASSPWVEEGHRQAGMNYTHGVWVSVSPLSGYVPSMQKAQELPRVEEFFPENDYPKSLVTGDIRGHTAWIRELPTSFSCGKTAVTEVALESSGLASPSADGNSIVENGTMMYDPSQTGNVSWVENGFVVEVAGPYDAATLLSFANATSFAR